jgi:EmrB/QacA subfamily drug resistance transporter
MESNMTDARPDVPVDQTNSLEVDYSRKWYVMAAVAMGVFLATIDFSIVNIALPTLVDSLDTDFATVQWVVLSYLLTLSTLLLSVGRLGDIRGKKRIYGAGFVVFTIGSLLCGISNSAYMLIAMRVIQGVGAAMVLALGPAIITEAFPANERGRSLGLIGSIVSIGIITGPVLGGLILGRLSWHWIFFVNLPVGLLGIWMVRRYVPDIPPTGGKHFDFLGAGALFISLLTLLLGLTFGQQMGFSDPVVLSLLGVWLIFLAIFIITELRVQEPMIDLRLFRNGLFSINLITGFLTFVAISGTILLLPFYLQNVRGLDIQTVGLMLMVTPIALGIVAPLSGSLSDRVGSRPVTVVGLIVLVFGYLSMSTLGAETSLVGYVLRLFPIGLGMGIFQSPNNSAIMGAVPKRALGVASSLLAETRTLGSVVGVAVLGAIWATRAVYYNSGPVEGGPTNAPILIQIPAMQDTFLVSAFVVSIALVLAVWAYVSERRSRTKATPVPSEAARI